MGIIGEMRGVPQSWDEYLYGLVGGPLQAIGERARRSPIRPAPSRPTHR